MARRGGWPYLQGVAYLIGGDAASLDRAEKVLRRIGAKREISLCLIAKAHDRTDLGGVSSALHLLDEAESLGGNPPSPGLLVRILRQRGRAMGLKGDGVEELREALELAKETALRPLALETAADLASLLAKRGDAQGARAVATDASAILREMTENVPTTKRPAYMRLPAVRVLRQYLG